MDRYQDALWLDGTEAGERDCAARWALIEPHVPQAGVVLDVGSNLGYFGLRTVQARPGAIVVSMESDRAIAAKQRAILQEHAADRITIVRGAMRSRLTREWVRTCDFVDLTLLLCVVHWFDDPAAVVADLSRLSGRMIVELPDHRDRGACGQWRLKRIGADPVAWLADTTRRRVTHLGRVERHTSDQPAHLLLVDGPVARTPQVAYWDSFFQHPDGNRYEIDWDGSRVALTIRGRPVDYIPGLNLVSLMKLGQLIYPSPATWVDRTHRAVRSAGVHGDPFPHNMLWTADGVVLIDGQDQLTSPTEEQWTGAIERSINAWAQNRTTSRGAYVRELLGPAKYLRRTAGRFLRSATSDAFVERLKERLRV